MKILPGIAFISLLTSTSLPIASQILGIGVNNRPMFSENRAKECKIEQKDKYGRCPLSTSSSYFRNGSILNSSGGGGGSFGGSK